jgi:hypothetical protein
MPVQPAALDCAGLPDYSGAGRQIEYTTKQRPQSIGQRIGEIDGTGQDDRTAVADQPAHRDQHLRVSPRHG